MATVPVPGAATSAAPVRRRRVFYISGFDPQGPAHYHRLHAEEAARQAAVGGWSVRVSGRRRLDAWRAGWSVASVFSASEGGGDPAEVHAEFEFLRWDDLVRANWPRSRWQVMLAALAGTGHQLRNGVLWRILKTSWPAFLVLAMPPLLVLGLMLAAVGGAWWAARVALAGGWLAAAVIVGVGGVAWWRFAHWAEARVQMAWLMRSTRYILRQARGATPELEARLDQFAARVAEVLAEDDVDEVMLVGHSSGAMLAVSTAARALRDARLAGGEGPDGGGAGRRLSLLTLGECIPMLSYQPEARCFREELAALARSPQLEWVDVTAPPDGCCFALVDPTAAARPAGAAPAGWRAPKRLSARFAQAFAPERYARLRKDKYRCHFQYLMATERPTDYDYFTVTGGPLRLADRFAAQRSVDDFRQFQMFGGPGP